MMSIPKKGEPQMSSDKGLFDDDSNQQPQEVSEFPTRDFDPKAAEHELRLRTSDVNQRVAKLEDAQIVSDELLSKVVSL